jgi:hypothetical protein
VTVHLQGGDLLVEVDADFHARLTGPAEEICTVELSEEFLESLTGAAPVGQSPPAATPPPADGTVPDGPVQSTVPSGTAPSAGGQESEASEL